MVTIAHVPFYLPRHQRRPDPEPLRTDGRRSVLVGTALWVALLVVSLVVRDDLVAAGRGWWTWTCVAGAVLGLVGLAYLHHRALSDRG